MLDVRGEITRHNSLTNLLGTFFGKGIGEEGVLGLLVFPRPCCAQLAEAGEAMGMLLDFLVLCCVYLISFFSSLVRFPKRGI